MEADAALHPLLDRVVDGEEIRITRDGKLVARLVPPEREEQSDDVRKAVEAMKEFRRGRTLGDQPSGPDRGRSSILKGADMDASPDFVLDGSIMLVWCFEDEHHEHASAILERMPGLRAHVPGVWPLEIANALIVGERRGRISPEETSGFLAILRGFPIAVDRETVERAWEETLRLARSYKLSSYDAAYLELAIRKGLPLASLDVRLIEAARVAGINTFTIAETP